MNTPAHTEVPPAARRMAGALLALLAVSLPSSTTGMQAAVVALLVLSAIARARSWPLPWRTPLDAPLLVFGFVCAVSTAASLHVRDASDWASLWIVAGYFVTYWWLEGLPGTVRFVTWWIVAAAVVAAYAILQHFTGIDVYREALGRATLTRPRAAGDSGYAALGFFRSYLTFGHAMLPPFALTAARVGRGGMGYAIAGALLTVSIIYSTARGAWLALAAMAIVLVLLGQRRRLGRAAFVLVGIIGLLLTANADLRGQARSMLSIGGVNAGRLAIYAANRDIVHDHPWLGLGFGRYRRASGRYYDAYPAADRRSHAHNNYLQIAAESGLLGLAAFMSIYGVALRRAGAAWSIASDPDRAELLVGAGAAVVGFMVGGLTQYTFGDNEVALAAWVVLALLLRSSAPETTA